MKKNIFFCWNNIWNISFVLLLGTLIYVLAFERDFYLSNEKSKLFQKCCLLVIGICSVFLSRIVVADEEKVYVCNFVGMTLSVIYWRNCTKCYVGNILESTGKSSATFKYIIIKDSNHKKIKWLTPTAITRMRDTPKNLICGLCWRVRDVCSYKPTSLNWSPQFKKQDADLPFSPDSRMKQAGKRTGE